MGSRKITTTCVGCGLEDHVDAPVYMRGPSAALDERHVAELAIAIRDGESRAASEALDLLFRDEPVIRDWIGKARGTVKRAAA